MTINIKNEKEEHMLLEALAFFVDYGFNTGSWMNSEYLKKTNDGLIKQNDYAKLCKRLGGKTRFDPTL